MIDSKQILQNKKEIEICCGFTILLIVIFFLFLFGWFEYHIDIVQVIYIILIIILEGVIIYKAYLVFRLETADPGYANTLMGMVLIVIFIGAIIVPIVGLSLSPGSTTPVLNNSTISSSIIPINPAATNPAATKTLSAVTE